jgi:DNA-binding CsgD family transcriptional regulator
MNKAVAIAAFKRLDLTSREADVLLCITRGCSNIEIGTNLGISPRTVKKHLEHIYSKIGVKSRLAAAARAAAASSALARNRVSRSSHGSNALS